MLLALHNSAFRATDKETGKSPVWNLKRFTANKQNGSILNAKTNCDPLDFINIWTFTRMENSTKIPARKIEFLFFQISHEFSNKKY